MARLFAGAVLASLLICACGASAQSPGSAEYYIKYGREYAEAGNADMAAMYFREGVQMYPGNAQMHFYLAQMLAASGDRTKAVAEFDAARRLDSSLGQKIDKALDYYDMSAGKTAAEADSDGPALIVPRTASAPMKVGDPIEVKDHASEDWFAGTVTEVQDISGNGTKFVYKVRYRNQVGQTENRFYPGSWRAPTGKVERAGDSKQVRNGGPLVPGDYQCTQGYYTTVGNYARQPDNMGSLSVKAGGSYTFRGSGGRYSYDPASGQIRWLSGYLAADKNSSTFRRNQRTSQIDMAFHTASGDLNWSCGHNL